MNKKSTENQSLITVLKQKIGNKLNVCKPEAKPKFKCFECKQIFSNEELIKSHFYLIHFNSEIQFKCHKQTQTDCPFVDQLSDNSYSNISLNNSFKTINKRKTNDAIDSNVETICGNSYQKPNNSIENKSKSSYGLKKHKTLEPIEPFIYLSKIILPNSENNVQKIDIKSIKTVFNCKKCEKQFKSLAQLSKHEKSFASESIKGLKCRECHILFDSETDSVLHKYSVHYKLFKKCFECDFITKSDYELREHSRLHQKLKGKQSEKCEKQQKSCENQPKSSQKLKSYKKQQNFEQKVTISSENSQIIEENNNLNKIELNAKPNINRKSGINCIECDFQTEDLELMPEHKRRHEWKPFECSVDKCGEYFDELNQLRKHLESKHRKFECEKCGQILGTFGQKHQHFKDNHFEDMVDCSECDEKFISEALAEKHRKSHRKECFKCPECAVNFKSEVYWETHVNKVHKKHTKYDCDDCEQKFYSKDILLAHLADVHNKRSFECDLCDEKYYKRASLVLHKAKHNAIAEYKCEVDDCGKTYKSEMHLNKHKLKVHLNIKSFPCVWPGCERRYKSDSSLKYHTMTHTGVKPFGCDYSDCDKRYINLANLIEHKRTHSSERNFQCIKCEKAFKTRMGLYIHTKQVHDKVESKPKRSYVCQWPECGKHYTDPNSFRYHMQSQHSGALGPFRCTETGCDKRFYSNSNLKVHMKTHSK